MSASTTSPTNGARTRVRRRILLPLANPRTAADLVRLGAALMEREGTLIALGVVEVPEGAPLSEGATRARHARRLLQRVLEFTPREVDIHTAVRIGRRAAEGIIEVAVEEEADLIVFGWGGPNGAGGGGGSGGGGGGGGGGSAGGSSGGGSSGRARGDVVFSPTIDQVVREAPCDIAVVKQRGIGEVRRILVPVRGGPHAELAVRFASAFARSFDAEVEVAHVVPPDIDGEIRSQTERALAIFSREHARGEARAVLIEGEDVAQAILREAESAQLVVMGATGGTGPGETTAESGVFGLLPDQVAQGSRRTVVVVKTREPLTRAAFDRRASQAESLEAADRAAAERRSIPARVDRWFGESSFHHREFDDLQRLVALKERQGVTISAVLPTFNEATTIGAIVRTARRELMERVRLVDELLVIDSASTDDTRVIAEREGARVIQHPDVLRQYGTYRGKGEALWKSLYETSGDLIAWSDTDITDWHPRFLYGPIGALLAHPRVGYVKAYYQRPIVQDGILREGGGGRVTELVARPLINLFFPELSGFIQPLSGEYAGRREHLERIPFFTGYAVEIGHLIDLAERLGIAGLGQVDLDVRVHRNQELEGLSRMSFVILQAVMKRLEARQRARLFPELGSSMKLPRSTPTRLALEVIDLADQERPPMVRVPAYLERRQRTAVAAART